MNENTRKKIGKPLTAPSLFLIAQREVYRQHLLASIELNNALRHFVGKFKETRVYFCLPFGLISNKIETIQYENKTLEYLKLPGGHICAPTFFKLPKSFQDNLEFAGNIINYESEHRILVQTLRLRAALYIGLDETNIEELRATNKFPSIEIFFAAEQQFHRKRIENPFLQGKEYFIEYSDYWTEARLFIRKVFVLRDLKNRQERKEITEAILL